MRAAVLPALNEDLQVLEDVEVIGPGPGQVLVRIAASGVCHSDISAQDGTFPMPVPCVLGHEGAGEVVALGEGVTGVSAGQHVVIAWVPPCGSCRYCLAGQPNLCHVRLVPMTLQKRFRSGDRELYGFAGTGTFAEEVVVAAEAVVPIGAEIPFDVASLLGCGVMTGVGAVLNTAKVRPGSSVAVIGCGGVGISVVQGARIAGAAEIVAVDLVEDKIEGAKRFGATHGSTPDGLKDLQAELGEPDGFDYVFEVVGLPATIRQAWDATRPGGTTVIVGAGRATAMVEFNAFELFYMERKLLGCRYGSADVRTDFARLLRLWQNGMLDLEGMISRRIDLSEINEAFAAMHRGEVIRSVVEFK